MNHNKKKSLESRRALQAQQLFVSTTEALLVHDRISPEGRS